MKIINREVKYERWSAHDSDDIYYYEVEHEGKIYNLKSIDQELDLNEIIERVLQLVKKEKDKSVTETEVKYRVYYKTNDLIGIFWVTEPYYDLESARELLKYYMERDDYLEGHIKEEITTKRIIERA